MTAPEFSDAQMIAWLRMGRLPPGALTVDDKPPMYRMRHAIAARLSATSADWQPPQEAERPDGFRCLGMWGPRWVVVEWTDLGHAERAMGWLPYPNGHSAITPAAFARLPPTPTQENTDG